MSEVVEPDNRGTPSHPHNRIYQALTSNQEDLIGHIAYSLYKRNKVAYIESIEHDLHRSPTDEEIGNFQRQACLSHSLDAYKNEAERVLISFTDEVLRETLDETNESLQQELDDIKKTYQEKLIDELKKANPFWRGVWQNILASFGVIAIFTLFIILAWGNKHGFKELMETIFDSF